MVSKEQSRSDIRHVHFHRASSILRGRGEEVEKVEGRLIGTFFGGERSSLWGGERSGKRKEEARAERKLRGGREDWGRIGGVERSAGEKETGGRTGDGPGGSSFLPNT